MSLKIAFLLAGGLGATIWSGSAFAAGPTCPDGPIRLGAISTITGPADFSEVPKAAKAMYDAVNSGWMDLGVEGTEHVPGATSARDVFAAALKAATE